MNQLPTRDQVIGILLARLGGDIVLTHEELEDPTTRFFLKPDFDTGNVALTLDPHDVKK